jgi:tRNA pseudouridine55 synthase
LLGILLIRKPFGLTSHDVVNDIRRRFSTKRVGHAGTLDPMATGLLVVAVGPATRFLQYLPLEPKEYVADITFGRSTTTYDAEGETATEGVVPSQLLEAIHACLPRFRGLIQQLPPMYSAIKVGGKPLYAYARQGQEIRRDPRTVHISTFDILDSNETWCKARIVCSGGTYIRSLAQDLGMAVGCGAHLSGLVRTRVGRFSLEEGQELHDVGVRNLISLRDARPPMPIVQLDASQTESLREGRPIAVQAPEGAFSVALLEPTGNVFSVARVQGDMLQPECVIPAEVSHGPF